MTVRWILFLTLLTGAGLSALRAQEPVSVNRTPLFEAKFKPLLAKYCHDCHGEGNNKGDVSLDDPQNGAHKLDNHELWLRIWKNLRSDLMPPAGKDQPTAHERREMLEWIEGNVFLLDPNRPDPGRVTIRRLNRVEYGHTIRDLLGIDYNVTENFPPDDTGYGFDTIGDVLTISPLLMEKYLAAAENIMSRAIPKQVGRAQAVSIPPAEFRQKENTSRTARFMRAGIKHTVGRDWKSDSTGIHRFQVDYQVTGRESAKDYKAQWQILIDGKKQDSREIRLDGSTGATISLDLDLHSGMHRIEFEMIPQDGDLNNNVPLAVKVLKVEVLTPSGSLPWQDYPEGYRRIFPEGKPPREPGLRDAYLRKAMHRIASLAYRRPVEVDTLDRLLKLVKAKQSEKGASLEDGIRLAMTAVLSSPSFLLRSEEHLGEDTQTLDIDEYSLATRLSYFLWSSTPDSALLKLAATGELRKTLRNTIDRMINDPKSERFIANFAGQWLQTRDVEGKFFDTPRVLGIDDGNKARQIFNLYTRQDMRRETELFLAHLLKENRPVVELVSANYSFINDRLAEFYGVDGVDGKQFRKVSMKGNPRPGGILTHGSFLIVTSNPTRTSPVKRGLFVLENILGVPPAPAPPNIPDLEESRAKLGKDATMREMMELHRSKPLCRSCHARMDPIGLALESYNAIGQWRASEDTDTAGKLVTGERFQGVTGLKEIIAGPRKKDFHRCLTEKLLTYALGRGIQYYDAPAVKGIISQAEQADGGLREFIYAIVESAPFQQKRRGNKD
ncbi:MAG: DUF1592 domain-containing protein [Verrucomicrobiaceae bacterium]|nr:DUF1592 domain-containing protein [Verrucomicrobiaceae bacterium]